MTTYAFNALFVDEEYLVQPPRSIADIEFEVEDVRLEVGLEDGGTGFSYTLDGGYVDDFVLNGDLQFLRLVVPDATMPGGVDYVSVSTDAVSPYIFQLSYDNGTATQVLELTLADTEDTFSGVFVEMGGTPLPDLSDLAVYVEFAGNFEDREGPITSGPFAPGRFIPFAEFAGLIEVTEDDLFVGTDALGSIFDISGDDTFSGGIGDDVFRMTVSGTDSISGGADSDVLLLMATGTVTLDLVAGTAASTEGRISFDGIERISVDIDDDALLQATGSAGADLLAITAFDGDLSFDGGAGIDRLDLSDFSIEDDSGEAADPTRVLFEDLVQAIDDGAGTYRLVDRASDETFATLTSVEEIAFADGTVALADIAVALPRPGVTLAGTPGSDVLAGGADDDTISGRFGDDTLRGGDGADVISGNLGFDLIEGGGGADRLFGANGFDTIRGGAGRDEILGGFGNDDLSGGLGLDTLNGGFGADTLSGGDGADLLIGLGGADELRGDAGNDTLLGGDGGDTLAGGSGADRLEGGFAFDMLSGGEGADTLIAGNGADTLSGEAGDDSLQGNAGADRLDGGAGADTLFGGIGADVFVFEQGYGVDTILDLGVVDRVQLDARLVAEGTTLSDYAVGIDGSYAYDFGGGDVLIFAGRAAIDVNAIDLVTSGAAGGGGLDGVGADLGGAVGGAFGDF